jgi:hypothetical protein
MDTALYPVVSSTHGRERRGQRDISKRDLQAAVKYGIKERDSPTPGQAILDGSTLIKTLSTLLTIRALLK